MTDMKWLAYDYACPKCGAVPHKACMKLNRIGPTRYMRVPHDERRQLSNENRSGNPRREVQAMTEAEKVVARMDLLTQEEHAAGIEAARRRLAERRAPDLRPRA